ncbi:hypothetical protein Droror1_Dr00021986 [Drosera rotundifolia]
MNLGFSWIALDSDGRCPPRHRFVCAMSSFRVGIMGTEVMIELWKKGTVSACCLAVGSPSRNDSDYPVRNSKKPSLHNPSSADPRPDPSTSSSKSTPKSSARIATKNFLISSSLLQLYSTLASPLITHRLLSSSAPTLSLFNQAIRTFSKTPCLWFDALGLYLRMVRSQLRPDNFTYPFLFNVVAGIGDVRVEAEAH